MGVEHHVRHVGTVALMFRDRLFEPPIILLAAQTKNPTRHRDGNPVFG